MKKLRTLTEFCDKSNIPASLIRAVVRQSGGWAEWDQTARDVTRGGADGGFHGFIFHKDTIPFAARNRDAILELARAQADDFGTEGEFAMIAGFRCLSDMKLTQSEIARAVYDARKRTVRSEDDTTARTQVLNALAWYALEEVARSYCDLTEPS